MLQINSCVPSNKSEKIKINLGNSTNKQEKQLLILYQKGLDELNLKNYNNAKAIFEKVINESNNNKDMYIKIAKQYEKINRLDDAYYFILMAINRKVDIDNMKSLLANIESRFEVVNLNSEIKKNSNFTLPNEIKMKINNVDKDVKITWENEAVNTSIPGTYTFNGYSKEYNHKVVYTLVIDKPIYTTLYGFFYGAINSNSKKYIIFNKADNILDGEKAKEKFDKLEAYSLNEDGSKKYFFSYYMENESIENIKYEVSDNAVFRIVDEHFPKDLYNKCKADNSFKEEILSKPAQFNEPHNFYIISFENLKNINYYAEIKLEDNSVIEVNQIPEVYMENTC